MNRRLLCLLPDRIATRMGLTVVAALVTIVAIGGLIRATEENLLWPGATLDVVERIAPLVALIERTPQGDRPDTARVFDAPDMAVSWRPVFVPVGEDRDGPAFAGLRRDLRARIGDPTAQIFIETRHGPGLHWEGATTPAAIPAGPDKPISDLLRVAVRLRDQSWLDVTLADRRLGILKLVHFAVPLLLAGLAIALLSWRAARKLTAPLARFAEAAERLGLDPDAPPLPELGPHEIRAATQAFNLMQTRLKRYVDDRMRLLAAMSHDLRTPLTRLRLRAELVGDEAQMRKLLADIAEMQSMIDATLNFAREDARTEPRVRADLTALLQTICDDLADMRLAVTLEDAARCPIACRPGALRRAITNLIDNAVKYGGRAAVKLAIKPDHVSILVEDDGPGIPADEFDRVFAPFYRVERSRSRDTGGVGLGLAVAKTIIHAHGGEITLENRPGGGLRAIVTLPRDVKSEPTRPAPKTPAAQTVATPADPA